MSIRYRLSIAVEFCKQQPRATETQCKSERLMPLPLQPKHNTTLVSHDISDARPKTKHQRTRTKHNTSQSVLSSTLIYSASLSRYAKFFNKHYGGCHVFSFNCLADLASLRQVLFCTDTCLYLAIVITLRGNKKFMYMKFSNAARHEKLNPSAINE